VTSLRYVRSYQDGARMSSRPFIGVHSHGDSSRFGAVPALLDTSDLRYGYEPLLAALGSRVVAGWIDAMATSSAMSRPER